MGGGRRWSDQAEEKDSKIKEVGNTPRPTFSAVKKFRLLLLV